MTLTRFFLLRHGESEWNARGLWQGQADPPLTLAGRAQAQARAVALRKKPPFDVLISSDLQRAAQTAELIGEQLGLPLCFDPRLRELDVGVWSGRTHPEIAERWPEEYAAYRAGDSAHRLGGGESFEMLAARVRGVLGELALRHRGKRILVVAHGGAIRSVLAGVHLANTEGIGLELTPELAREWEAGISSAGVSGLRDSQPSLVAEDEEAL